MLFKISFEYGLSPAGCTTGGLGLGPLPGGLGLGPPPGGGTTCAGAGAGAGAGAPPGNLTDVNSNWFVTVLI